MGSIFNKPNLLSLYASALSGRRRVTHIRTHVLYDNSWEFITHLAGDGFVATKEEAVEDIRSLRFLYHTNEDGTEAPLIVESSLLGNAYVRTKPDCSRANNLLSLPRF
ncbi:DUF3892 domain-containing protein [Reyranella sp.]|uniref:DUF3892 domain-containing protein n=1 Tax=Reyranella sp. TaxID=1929291 RepID=UPI003C7A8C07